MYTADMKIARDFKDKFSAAEQLLSQTTTTREKIASLTSLLTGAHPKLDNVLKPLQKQLANLGSIAQGDVIQLSADNLPEHTEEDKKRKRALLLFIKTWKDVQTEFARVKTEFEKAEAQGGQDANMWGRIFGAVKGPLAIATVIAVGAAALHTTAVTVSIENDGCGTIQAASSVPISLPGLSLPNEPINAGESSVATLPPLPLSVDGTSGNSLSLKAAGLSLSIELSGVKDVTFDGESLLNKSTELSLGSAKEHTLMISCL
jgi:hypothetical protein